MLTGNGGTGRVTDSRVPRNGLQNQMRQAKEKCLKERKKRKLPGKRQETSKTCTYIGVAFDRWKNTWSCGEEGAEC